MPGTADLDTLKNTRAMLLSWFEREELGICPECGSRHLLPAWGTAAGQFCATCGLLGLEPDRRTSA